MDFPPNSDKSKQQPSGVPGPKPENKNIKRVTSEDVKRRKKPFGTKFKETFIVGDGKAVGNYVLFEVLIPNAKNAIEDAVAGAVHRMLNGDSPRRRGYNTPPQSGPTGVINYGAQYRMSPPQRQISRRARAAHDFDEIVLSSRVEAEQVLDSMFDILDKYESVSVADLYELTGLASTHQDMRWGWTNMSGASVQPVRSGYLLNLPEPQPLA